MKQSAPGWRSPTSQLRPDFIVPLIVVVLSGTVLRALTLRESLWLDELHTSWSVHAAFEDVTDRAHAGNQSPIYYWLVWACVQIFGHHEVSLRLVSIVCGALAMPAIACLARHRTRSISLALMAALIVAIDGNFIYYAREARPYAMIQLLAIGHLAVFLARIEHPSRRLRLGWIGLTWIMFYTHYTSFLLVGGELCWWIGSRIHQRRWTGVKMLAADFAVASGGCLLSLRSLAAVAARRENWAKFVSVESLSQIASIFPFGVYIGIPVLVSLALAFFVWRSRVISRIRTARLFRRGGPFWATTCFFPVVCAFALTWIGIAPLFFRRYVIVSSVPLVLLACCFGTYLRPEKLRRIFALVCCLLMTALLPRAGWTTHNHEDWRAAVDFVAQQNELKNVPILLRGGLIEDDALPGDDALALYCQFPLSGIYAASADKTLIHPLPSRRPLDMRDVDGKCETQMRIKQRAWLVSRGTQEVAQQMVEQLTDVFRTRGVRVTVLGSQEFPGIQVVELKVDDLAAADN